MIAHTAVEIVSAPARRITVSSAWTEGTGNGCSSGVQDSSNL